MQEIGFTESLKLEDIHRPKLCTITFFICHYTDFGNEKCRPRIGLFRTDDYKTHLGTLVLPNYKMFDGAISTYSEFFQKFLTFIDKITP